MAQIQQIEANTNEIRRITDILWRLSASYGQCYLTTVQTLNDRT